MTAWKWVALAGTVCLAAILMGAAATRAHPSDTHKKLFASRWYQQVTGGDYDAWMTLSTSDVWLDCDGNPGGCGAKWFDPFDEAIADWNSQPTTVRHDVTLGDRSLNYDVNVDILDEVFDTPGLLGLAMFFDQNYDFCPGDCTIRYGWVLVGDDWHTGPYGTTDAKVATIAHEIGHLLSLRHESVNADESVHYPCGQDDTGPIPHSIMAYNCIDPVAVGGLGETYIHDWDVCGVNHAYYDPNWGYAGCTGAFPPPAASNNWYVFGNPYIQWGASYPGDIPVPGDYNGDGQTDAAIWRPSSNSWYVYGLPTIQWGASYPGDIPVPGDYNGDVQTDAAIWRP